MKKLIIVANLIVLIVFGSLFVYFNKGSAEKVTDNQFEYGAITAVYYFELERERINKIFGLVEFCQMQVTGCKSQEIRYELDYGKFLKENNYPENINSRNLASLKASEIAFQNALAKLGNAGWELIGEPDQDFKSVSLYSYENVEDTSLLFSKSNTKAIYFKRQKK